MTVQSAQRCLLSCFSCIYNKYRLYTQKYITETGQGYKKPTSIVHTLLYSLASFQSTTSHNKRTCKSIVAID